jgi:uncharacterized protein
MNAKEFVSQIFHQWEQGDSSAFFNALAPDLIWTARGRTAVSGTVHGKQVYIDKIYKPLQAFFAGPTACRVIQILADGNTVIVEFHGETPTTTGVKYFQDYRWLIRLSEDAKSIREVTGYFDTALVDELLAGAKLNPRHASLDERANNALALGCDERSAIVE